MSEPQPTAVPAETRPRQALGPAHLVMAGIGAIIGAGIFVITGQAAAMYAGPAITISFGIAGLGCLFAGLCYAEFASLLPAQGSAYTYAYATLGQFVAWLIGWDLILEFLTAAGTVASGWSGYFNGLMAELGYPIPEALSRAPFDLDEEHLAFATGAIANVPAMALVLVLTLLLIIGGRTPTTFKNLVVALKIGVILLVIGFGLSHIQIDNLTPFVPEATDLPGQYGWLGVLRGAGVVFFAYIGFDAIAAQEAKNPQRDVVIGIVGALIICTILYALMALTITGLQHFTHLNVPNPVSVAIEAAGSDLAWLAPVVNVVAIIGLAALVRELLRGQSRIFFALARDGLLPPAFGRMAGASRTPYLGGIAAGLAAAALAGFLPLAILIELVSIGTLFAFIVVCIAVMVLRSTAPNTPRAFRTPLVPLVPLLGIGLCGAMMYVLPADTWLRFAFWMFIGLIVYGVYGMHHARAPKWTLVRDPKA
jgi:basic amino acid/polyamine antiporter, APA family